MIILQLVYPSLPFLSEIMQSEIVQILSSIHNIGCLRKESLPNLQERLIFEIPSFKEFKEQLLAHIKSKVVGRLKEVRVVPITVGGPQSELTGIISKRFVKLLSNYGIAIRGKAKKEKVYEWYSTAVIDGYITLLDKTLKKEDDFIREFGEEWKVKVSSTSLEFSSPRGSEYNFPAIVRTSLLYEQARFSGMRDMKESGSVTRGVFKIRCSPLWYMRILDAAISSLIVQIQLTRGEFIQLYVGINLHPGVEYEPLDISNLNDGIDTIALTCSRVPLLEDLELMKYLIMFNLYYEGAYTLKPAEFVIYGLKPEGLRFTVRFSLPIGTEEISMLGRKLETLWGDQKDEIVEALKDFGEFLIRLYKVPAFQQELPLDRLILTYKFLCYASTEPGYKSPLEFIYELVRIMNEENIRPRLWGLLRKHLQDKYKLSEEEANEKVKRIWSVVTKLAESA